MSIDILLKLIKLPNNIGWLDILLTHSEVSYIHSIVLTLSAYNKVPQYNPLSKIYVVRCMVELVKVKEYFIKLNQFNCILYNVFSRAWAPCNENILIFLEQNIWVFTLKEINEGSNIPVHFRFCYYLSYIFFPLSECAGLCNWREGIVGCTVLAP